jgi:limonene-1,2-epoxide hydrolase
LAIERNLARSLSTQAGQIASGFKQHAVRVPGQASTTAVRRQRLRSSFLSDERHTTFCRDAASGSRFLGERLARKVADRRVILFRSEGVFERTRSQTMRRIRKTAKLKNPERVTWYSIRHTLADWLYERVSGKITR